MAIVQALCSLKESVRSSSDALTRYWGEKRGSQASVRGSLSEFQVHLSQTVKSLTADRKRSATKASQGDGKKKGSGAANPSQRSSIAL